MGILRKLIFVVALMALPMAGQAACAPDRLDVRGDFGSVSFTIEVAKTNQQIQTGLMHRTSMPRMSGMLFVYQRQRLVAFWMRNTLIPLDMVFIDRDGVIAKIHPNAVPLDETPIPSEVPVKYVLEINGGMAAILGLQVGDQVRHPEINGKNAVWPCA